MPLVGESAWNIEAITWGADPLTMTFDLDFPPQAAFIKVALGEFAPYDRNPAAAFTGLVNMRRRKPDNSDETITFPNVGMFDVIYTQFNPTMTHVTVGIMVINCEASLVWTLGVWA
jgi:hypothetical protein